MSFNYDRKSYASLEEETAVFIEMTGWLAHNKLETFLKTFKTTPQQYNVLRILREAKGVLPTLEIPRRMYQKLPDITRLIDRLEKVGFIHRERSTTDRRIVMIHLTPKGFAFLENIDDPLRAYCKQSLNHMTKSELQQLVRLLKKAQSPTT